MHRVFCQDIPPSGSQITLEAREAEHLFKVFRAAPGDKVELLNGRGGRAGAVVVPGKKVEIVSVEQTAVPEDKIYLCCALPRRQKLDQMFKQAVELGVWSIVPLNCERSVAEGGNRERWELLLREACKQSGNPFMPELKEEMKLAAALEELKKEDIDIYFGDVNPVELRMSGKKRKKALLIGPEGGFSPTEFELIEKYDCKGLNLSPHILRIETAAVAGVALLRFLSILFAGMFFMMTAGCGQADMSKNPLLLKAAKLQASGDVESAGRFYRQAVARYPESPEVYLALAKICAEELNDPYEAIFAYRSFLQLSPEDDERRDAAEKMVRHLEETISASGKKSNAEFERLQRENVTLKESLSGLKKTMISQQLTINQLKSENDKLKAAASVKNRKSRKNRR